MRNSPRASVPLALLALPACDGIQTMVGGDGLHGRHFNDLFTLFMVVTGIAYLLVILFLGAAVLRRRGKRQDGLPDEEEGKERGISRLFAGWVAFIVVGLTVLTISSYFTDRAGAKITAAPAVLQVVVTANQWWWEVQYLDPTPSNIFRTANELHLPAGIPAHIRLRSNDVIHSFWVPNLAGKQDLIPGRDADVVLKPLREGVYRAQCAEYCGMQHAHMALDVTVESREAFDQWRRQQLAPPAAPSDPLRQAGYNVFMGRQCSSCHTISGTPANGVVGPDLTHFASRRSIAAGTLPMSRGHLYGWIADPQSSKPGNRMPSTQLSAQELHAVVAYLEGLK